MSELLPGQQIQRLVTKAVRDAYDEGRQVERERIIKALRNEQTAKTLMVLARNTDKQHPQVIQTHAWGRIKDVLRQGPK